jgi:hypothetical protein
MLNCSRRFFSKKNVEMIDKAKRVLTFAARFERGEGERVRVKA